MAPPADLTTIVFAARSGDLYRAGRTIRALAGLGISAIDATADAPGPFAARLNAVRGPVWLLRAGAWPRSTRTIRFPPASASRRALIAFGRVVAESDQLNAADARGARAICREAALWTELLARCGGELTARDVIEEHAPIASMFVDASMARDLAARWGRRASAEVAETGVLTEVVREIFASADESNPPPRVVHVDDLDVVDDERRRVLQVVTTLQRGGAERVALDLATELPRFGVNCRLVAWGRPTRGAFSCPRGTIDLSATLDRGEKLGAVARAARDWRADLIHAHLLRGDEVAALSRHGTPVVTTAHNMRPGWPPGFEAMAQDAAAMVIACSQAVEADLRGAGLRMPIRTAWNGIEFGPLSADRRRDARELRHAWGFGPDDFVLLALSNPRPQKRWEVLPEVLLAAQREFRTRGIRRRVRLVVAGESESLSPAAAACVAAFRQIADSIGVSGDVRLIGLAADIPLVLAASDALVSTSAYEGLSLAQLEALAARKPIVATDVGGTREIASEYPECVLVAADAPAEEFAAALARYARRSENGQSALSDGASGRSSFSRDRMAERHAWLYDRAIAGARRRSRQDGMDRASGGGVLLVANNFSTGGAQSSARRLLLALAERGVRVRAAVIEEQPEYPTPGRRALLDAGIDVLALPTAGTVDPAVAVRLLLEFIDAKPPNAVLFWNVIAEYKVLIADALRGSPNGVRIVDVSPGEMFYTSLTRYFARPRVGLPYRTLCEYGARLDAVVVKYAAEAEAAEALGVPVRVIPNGVLLPAVETTRFADRTTRRGTFVLGTSARISTQKRLEDLIVALRRAHRRMPPYALRIAGRVERGGEEYVTRLAALARGLPVEFVGEFADAREFLRELDLFVMISEPAGCPNASLEALAHGLPVVATDFGGVSEQVIDGVTGRLTPRGDGERLADAIVELATDGEMRRRLGMAARRHVAEHFSIDRMAEAYLSVCGLRSQSATPHEPKRRRVRTRRRLARES